MATPLEHLKRLKFGGGLELLVDGFQFQQAGIHHYVLSHFHADHTIGLTKNFAKGVIYCTEGTGRLVSEHIGVAEQYLQTVALNKSFRLGDVTMTFLDAGHCPGSAIIAFEEANADRILIHTGDVRASQRVRDGILHWLNGRSVNELYLDTTYCSPRWDFPDQEVACGWMQELVRQELSREADTLFLVGSYQIGKEKAARAVAEAANSSVFVDQRRWTSIKLTDWADENLLSGIPLWSIDKADCKVWMLPLGGMDHEALLHHLESSKGCFKSVVAFRPTGWSFNRAQRLHGVAGIKPWIENDGKTRLYGVPYSEHSSFTELKALVATLKPKRVIPTVNAQTRESKEQVMAPLLGLLNLEEDRERMDFYLASWLRGQCEEGSANGCIDVLALSSGASSLSSLPRMSGSDLPDSGMGTSSSSSCLGNPLNSSAKVEPCQAVLVESSSEEGDRPTSESKGFCLSQQGSHVRCSGAPQESVAQDPQLRQVDTAQQARLLKYFETLKMQADATLHAKAAAKRKPPSLRKSAKGKGKGKALADPSKSALASMLGVKSEDGELKGRRGKSKRKAVTGPTQPRKQRRTAAKPQSESEKRAARFVPKASARIRERMDRAFMHRLYLLAKQDQEAASGSAAIVPDCNPGVWLDVLGSTGNVYRVSLSSQGNRCECMDFAKGGGVCKHLLFVMMRVLKLGRDDHRVWQTALTASELHPLLETLRQKAEGATDLVPDQAVLRGYRTAKEGVEAHVVQPLPAECPICFEEICEGATSSTDLDSTKSAITCGSCGHHLHTDCHRRWASSSPKGDTCPLCRSPWKAPCGNGDLALNLSAYSAAPQPSLEELYPETHRWITTRDDQSSQLPRE